ncbi:hypothetical protein BUALT_Bualt03G0219900 [Buddleja alternifolia]|uniref:BHLH domain-containing protein n=1 Tax=Buddleja alternifolia TaxID=168488 RepID=A0AAV6Y2C4_9LAMI|nr:hypothetical protein BUALT_Bualt03G0219900 [Buddleja alternifolia]
MDTYTLPDWNTEVGFEFPVPGQKKSLGLENELMELLWENGEVVLHSQTQRKESTSRSTIHNPNTLIQDDETVSWITCPIDESFEKEFCANFLSEIPPVEANRLSGLYEGEKVSKVGVSDVNNVLSNSQLPPPRFEAFGKRKTSNLEFPVKKPGFDHKGHDKLLEGSIMTIGSSHCASNQVNNEMEENYAWKVSESMGTDLPEQAITSSSGGSGSSFWKRNDKSNETNSHKRKKRDMEESQCQSDATELESGAGNKSSQKPGTSRRTRVAEVHNLSERRRRDRINEKMRALQELIPHSNKSDKASMLDEAIEYMKSLQLQIQLMWMGGGMAPMMLPGMQHYMSRLGMRPSPPTLPTIQNLMRLSRYPFVDQAPIGQTHPMLSPVNYPNQMHNSRFAEQYANYMGFHSTHNASQPINMFNFGSHSAQQNHVLAPPGNGDGSIG